jgi:hypothetical protein
MNASEKEIKLDWLKAEIPDNTCRILSNVRCLSEGVDVPALDAVLFLTPRNSQVDVVQSVGRVMRNAPGKKRGYIILPRGDPGGCRAARGAERQPDLQSRLASAASAAFARRPLRRDGEQARLDRAPTPARWKSSPSPTRSRKSSPSQGPGKTKDQTAKGATHHRQPEAAYRRQSSRSSSSRSAKSSAPSTPSWCKRSATATTGKTGPTTSPRSPARTSTASPASWRTRRTLASAKLSRLCRGTARRPERQHHATRSSRCSRSTSSPSRCSTRCSPDYSFARQNPMSQAMQGVLDVLHEHRLDKEADTLQAFYDSVKLRAEGIDSARPHRQAEDRRRALRQVLPQRLPEDDRAPRHRLHAGGDRRLHHPQRQHLLQTEFGQTLGSKGVHILDPFTGTGTFITRLLQSGLIAAEELPHKYKHEIHANEIVLLAYYIAAINIEAVYHGHEHPATSSTPSFRA